MNTRIAGCILALDIAWQVMILSHGIPYARLGSSPPASYAVLVLTVAGMWMLLFRTFSLDCFQGGWRFHIVLSRILRAAAVWMILATALAYLTRVYYSAFALIVLGATLFVGFLLIRVGMYFLMRRQHSRGHTRRVVLVGKERFTREFAFKIVRHPELLRKVVGMLYPVGDGTASDGATATVGKLLSSFEVLGALAEQKIDELIVLLDESPGLEFQNFVERCRSQGIDVKMLPRGYELYTSKPKLIEIDGLPLISLEHSHTLPCKTAVKRAMDLVISTLLLPPAACVFLFTALILFYHGRPILRRERRIGKGGRAFWMYRLDIDREGEGGPRYDRLMRDLSISEIPQLWNVLVGEMSLVGPRPESPERVKNYSEWQKERLRAKPGMTGLAQVNDLREQHASEDKTRFDLQYLLEWTPLTDLVLLLQTFVTLAKRCLPAHSPVVDAKFTTLDAGKRALPLQQHPF
jgi:lipopolysaccharide/colanic/teichoic acid biosynthesis glycosyltransferase